MTMVRRVVEEIWNQDNLQKADALFSPGYVNHGGLILDVVHGPEAIKMSVVICRSAFPDLWVAIDDLQANGDQVLVRWTAHTSAPFHRRSEAPDLAPKSMAGTIVCRFAEGAIAETWVQWDRPGMLRRLGLAPALE